MTTNRAYSILEIKAVNEDARIIEGIATTPTPDRMDDVVEPKGVEFSLPLPLLWQHDSSQPIGQVTKAVVTNDGIRITAQIASIAEPGLLKDRLDEAWQSIKSGLVRGLSIGFKGLETANIEGSFGIRFLKWLWLELSAVTIPANAEASIMTLRSIDQGLRKAEVAEPEIPEDAKSVAATGKSARVVRLDSPARDGAKPYVIRSIKRTER